MVEIRDKLTYQNKNTPREVGKFFLSNFKMGSKKKSGRKSSGSSQKLEMKSKKVKAVNPFERKFGRAKHTVLNRKSQTNEAVGKPGIARQKALNKVNKTLQEKALRN